MTRGHGHIQRAVLDQLRSRPGEDDDLISLRALAGLVFDADERRLTPSETETIRRACRTLAIEGLVERFHFVRDGHLQAAVRLLADSVRTQKTKAQVSAGSADLLEAL